VPAIRAFVAIPIPEPLCVVLGGLRRAAPAGAPVRWTGPDSIHLTLKFLGDVEPERLDAVRGALSSFPWNLAPFAFTLSRVGGFPSLSRPRVLWVGVTAGAERLVDLAGRVERALGTLDFPREERAFSPHLTIGRVKAQGPRGWAEAFARDAHLAPVEVLVSEIRLYRSELLPSGARHTVLHAVPLAASEER
jgi:2'-5' RNA ligase